jgi:arylsulfatase A-like enzyme
MVSAVDDGVGRVLNTLDELDLAEDTLVFFLSDNGGATTNGSINTPLRGYKGSVYEGGMRVPFAFRWKGKIPAGVDYDPPVSSMDILATMVKLTGVDISPDRPLDGVDLMPYLSGKNKGVPHESLFWLKFDADESAVRIGDDKLVVLAKDNSTDLYQLSDDIAEANDLSGSQRAKTAKLQKKLETWKAGLMDPVFDPLGTWDP